MPTAGMIFDSGPARITCDRSGWVRSIRHQARPDGGYLQGAAVGTMVIDGTLIEAPVPEVYADVDEVEFVYTYPDRLRLVVRHTFAAGWGIRLAFSSLAPETQRVAQVQLRLEPDPQAVAWALPLGVSGSYAVVPAGGAGPVLGGLLRRGSVDSAGESGLTFGAFELRPGSRFVAQLQWDWYASPRAFAHVRLGEAPSALVVTVGESVQVRVDPDVAVVVPIGLESTQTDDQLDLVADTSGRYPVELRSARGTTAFELAWVDPTEELLAGLVAATLTQPRTTAGVVKLADVAQALLVQHAAARNQVDDADAADEALDLFTARLGSAGPVSPLEAAYLCREYDRMGDADLLAAATDAVLAQTRSTPGLGLAATQLCLALIVSGQPVTQVLEHLSRLVHQMPPPDLGGGAVPVAAQAAALELIAVTYAGPGATGTVRTPVDVAPRTAGLGAHLGAGMPGRAVRPLPVDELSHLIIVLQLLPDGLSGQLGRLWGRSAHALARAATPELLARLAGAPITDAHAWLVLGLATT